MAAPRPSYMLNSFYRAVRSCRPTTYRSIRNPPTLSRSELHSTTYHAQTAYPNRYGPAATEGLPPPPKPSDAPNPAQQESKSVESPKSQSEQPQQQQQQQQKETLETTPEAVRQKLQKHIDEKEAEQEESAEDEEDPMFTSPPPETQAAPPSSDETPSNTADIDTTKPLENKELDIVLSVPSPSEVKDTAHKPRHPHLEPSPYEHHFDTHTLVQELAKDPETFTEEQSITLMKAIRLMLSLNLDLAKEGLVSKSNIENESYLFRAACSELRTTLQSTRAAESQRQRTQRAQLQHEMDILNQKVSQDVSTMREDMKGMFNDRKMSLQEEKRKIDSKISELNYEITVLLNSEAKSEVEGLRWVLTRRAALAIGTAAFMTLSALQYYSVKSREYAEVEKKRAAAQKAQEERIASESQMRYTTPSRNSGTQTEMRDYAESLG